MFTSQNNNDFIYVVGVFDCESNEIQSLHRTYNGAFHAWSKARREIIKDYQKHIDDSITNRYMMEDLYIDGIRKLQCDNPKLINNYPLEEPYILKMRVEE